MRRTLGMVLLLVVGSAQATNVIIDFEDPNIPRSYTGTPEDPIENWSTQGFDFNFVSEPPGRYYAVGSNASGRFLSFCQFNSLSEADCSMEIQHSAGETFSLNSFDATDFVHDNEVLELTGFLAGGGSLSATFILTYEMQTFSVGWNGLIGISFANGTVMSPNPAPQGIDNINVNVVPIPAAVWLFGSGLGLLGWFRSRSKTLKN
jgi:hypothetical protein